MFCLGFVVTALTAMQAQQEFQHESDVALEMRSPESDAPWELSAKLLSGLERGASRFVGLAVRLSSHETATVVRPTPKGWRENSLGRDAYSLTVALDEVRTHGGKPDKRKVFERHAEPAPYSWLLLFSADNQPYFRYREIDGVTNGLGVRSIEFRGAMHFSDGRDIRQWQGTVLVNSDDHSIVRVVAEPKDQQERIRVRLDRRNKNMGFRIGPGGPVSRAGPRVRSRRTTVLFNAQLDSLRLPSESRNEVRIVDHDWSRHPEQTLIRRFDGWTLDPELGSDRP
jgi:hypothetical protein